MPEALVHHPVPSADITGCARPFGKERTAQGPELTLNNGWGRVRTACSVRTAETSGSVSGTCAGRWAISRAEGGPAVLIVDVVVRGDRRGQGLGRG